MIDLSNHPVVRLANTPTPVDVLPRLSEHLGGPHIYMKRDDYTGLGLGGNKVRKLEFLIGDALAHGCDTLVTIGGIQSNHCRQTAAAAARLGLKCHLVLTAGALNGTDFAESGNVLLDRLTGSTLHLVGEVEDKLATLAEICAQVESASGKPYPIVMGGSSAIGSLGYVAAVQELRGQLDLSAFRAIVVTTGSAGTQAGLAAGLSMLGLEVELIGASCSLPREALETRLAGLAAETMRLAFPGAGQASAPRIVVDDNQVGSGYGLPTAACLEALRLCAELEGIFLDPVYTGKAMASLIAMIRQRRFGKDDKVLFVHTGGSPALFAYREHLAG